MENFKKCSKCGRELPASEFWKNASTEDGLQTYCKECGNVYAKNRKYNPQIEMFARFKMKSSFHKTKRII